MCERFNFLSCMDGLKFDSTPSFSAIKKSYGFYYTASHYACKTQVFVSHWIDRRTLSCIKTNFDVNSILLLIKAYKITKTKQHLPWGGGVRGACRRAFVNTSTGAVHTSGAQTVQLFTRIVYCTATTHDTVFLLTSLFYWLIQRL